jgi:hypothetical protein
MASSISVGQLGNIPVGGSIGAAEAGLPPDSPSQSFADHVQDPANAHMATAIGFVAPPPGLPADNVQQAIDALTGAVIAEPPKVGEWKPSTSFSGIPDWGILKLTDGDLQARGLLTSDNDSDEIYPYYYVAPSPAKDPEFTIPGNDPETDPLWNSGFSSVFPFNQITLPGAGTGFTFSGAFTRDGSAVDQPVMRTARLMPRLEVAGTTYRIPAVVSGSFYPADRGVLALIHWPSGGTMASFLAQPLLDRCIAATLCGQGVMGSSCFKYGEEPAPGDGDPGGIFAVGRKADGSYDPFAFPGRASGQYDLREIVNGVATSDGSPLVAPWDDWDQDGVAGARRFVDTFVPGPGQVRLGTVPEADNDLNSAPVQPYGIPVLGGNADLYSPIPATLYTGYLGINYRILEGVGGVANTVIWNTGEDRNFFGYRLPVLKDYSPTTGLRFTPRGVNALSTKESVRFFNPKTPNSGVGLVSGNLASAGNYPNFDEDFWTWQVGRYRHTFLLPDTEVPGAREEVGTYHILHFKRESDFEAFVRDGIAPNDPVNGYSLYGSYLIDSVPSNPETDGNVANQEVSANAFAPAGPAPAYGYAAEPYHTLRSTMILDPDWMLQPGDMDGGIVDANWTWTTDSTALDPHVMWVSGVRYLLPRRVDTGAQSLSVDISVLGAAGIFWGTYRTNDNPLTGNPGVAPAVISSPNPMLFGVAPFSFESVASVPTYDVNTVTDSRGTRNQRFELPYTYMGSNGSGPFSEVNGPGDADLISVTGTGFEFFGDLDNPSFSSHARMRAFTRRPLAYRAANGVALPFDSADGHGEPLIRFAAPSERVLFHSVRFSSAGTKGSFGNFLTGPGPGPVLGYSDLFGFLKDGWEKFLDESYRYRGDFGVASPSVPAAQTANLNGPGMAGWAGGFIPVPVRAGLTSEPGWEIASWLQMFVHEDDLGTVIPDSLQVAGLPERNPPASDGSKYPFPSAGLLLYPQIDYTTDYRPSDTDGDIPSAQPDYSGLPGTGGNRTYLRAFDAAWSHSGNPADVAGQPFFTIRIDGLTLADFAYSPGGPGALGVTGIAIMVKVPGLTTWMDLGRRDGTGPSKQDAILDGAGCLVLGPETFDDIDPETGVVYSQVRVNVGPFVNLTPVLDPLLPSQLGEVPILVKVILSEVAADYTFDREATGPGTFAGFAGPGVSSNDVRGIVGIRIVRTDGQITGP